MVKEIAAACRKYGLRFGIYLSPWDRNHKDYGRAEYLKYFRGRRAIPVSAYGPQVDAERAWSVFKNALGLTGDVAEGDPVRATIDGLPPIDGVVDYVSKEFLGVRTSDGLYRFIHGLGGTVVLGHHVYSDADQEKTEQAWQSWVERAFA